MANVAFSNGGGIRTSIAGPATITEKSTFDVLPFDNVIVTVPNVSAARLKELMEWGVAAHADERRRRFPQIAGFKLDGRARQPERSPSSRTRPAT